MTDLKKENINNYDTTTYEEIIENVINVFKSINTSVTQKEYADYLGISKYQLSRIFTRQTSMSAYVFFNLCNSLTIVPSQLISEQIACDFAPKFKPVESSMPIDSLLVQSSLLDLRLKYDYSQEQIAYQMYDGYGVDVTFICKRENGQTKISLNDILEFCKVLGITLDDYYSHLMQLYKLFEESRFEQFTS